MLIHQIGIHFILCHLAWSSLYWKSASQPGFSSAQNYLLSFIDFHVFFKLELLRLDSQAKTLAEFPIFAMEVSLDFLQLVLKIEKNISADCSIIILLPLRDKNSFYQILYHFLRLQISWRLGINPARRPLLRALNNLVDVVDTLRVLRINIAQVV